MSLNFLNKLSFLRLTGKTRYLLINIYQEVIHLSYIEKKESLFKITKSDIDSNSYKISNEATYTITDDISEIKGIIGNFLIRNKIQDALCISGVNEYKLHSIKIPADTDDIISWFSENSSKFIPEGHLADEFISSFEKYYSNEDSSFCWFMVARKDFIKEICDSCSRTGLIILGIYPFTLSIKTLESLKEQNVLYIDLFSPRIQFLYCSSEESSRQSGNCYYGETYKQLPYGFIQEDGSGENQFFFESILNEIKDSITIWRNTTNYKLDKLFINAPAQYYTIIKKVAVDVFNLTDINNSFESKNFSSIGALFTLNKIINNYDSTINLLPVENRKEEKLRLEKHLSLKLALVSGLTVIFLLLLPNVLKEFLMTTLENNENELETLDNQSTQIETFHNEKDQLLANLDLYNKLKLNKKNGYSPILLELTKVLNNNICLLDLKIKENTVKKINIEITGCAFSQSDLAELLKQMEGSSIFSEIMLHNSEFVETRYVGKGLKISNKELVKFNLTANYNVN